MDVLFINPGSAKDVYQGLSTDYSGIGTPYWLLLLSQSCRSQGYDVGVLDVLAEKMLIDDAVKHIEKVNPRLITFCVYGENVNSGTTQMSGAVRLANAIKDKGIKIPVSFVGSHVQALPYKVLDEEPNIDIIFTNEGVYSLWNVLKLEDLTDLRELENIKGIGFVKDGKPFVHLGKSQSTGKILIQVGDELGTVTSKILSHREAFKIAYRLLDMVYDKIRQDEK